MTEIRFLHKQDGEKVLQYREHYGNGHYMGTDMKPTFQYTDWKDVPVVSEEQTEEQKLFNSKKDSCF